MSAAAEHSSDGMSLAELRKELCHLVALADSAERPKPSGINPPGHPMPGYEWLVHQRTLRGYPSTPTWWVRTVDEDECSDVVYVSSPDSMAPGDDFIAMPTDAARQLAMALLAAADRADHQVHGVPRLEDRRRKKTRPTEGDSMT